MIEVYNLTKAVIDRKFLKKVARIVLKGENVKMKDISVIAASKERIRELNKKYRKKDKATDVLSFNYGDSGEVVICPEVIRENAEKFGNIFKKEIARILIHGMLHLAGYDHEKSAKEAKKMEIKEKSYTKLFY